MTGPGEPTGHEAGLRGRAALVTGASGGIGGAIAEALVAAGVDVALGSSSRPDDVAPTARDHAGRGRTLPVYGDLADPSVPARLVEQTADVFGSCDLLVVSSGVGRRHDWESLDPASWNRTLDVNLRAPWLLSQAALPGMTARGFGRILYISSVAALNGGVIGADYAASKAGLIGLMHHLAPRVAGRGVTVNTLAPGPIGGTRMVPVDPDSPDTPPLPVPVGRLGAVDEVARLALAMVSNGFLTDQTVALDGGIVPR